MPLRRSGEIVARPGYALRVVRSPAPYRRRSQRCSHHRRCHASTASCTGVPHRRSTWVARSSPKTGISSPSGVRTCVGRSPGAPSSRRSGANKSRSGSLLAVSHGNPLRSSIRRNARRLSPSRPCQPRLATSSRSPAMDFTGYRKSACTCPISARMFDPSRQVGQALVAVVVLSGSADRNAKGVLRPLSGGGVRINRSIRIKGYIGVVERSSLSSALAEARRLGLVGVVLEASPSEIQAGLSVVARAPWQPPEARGRSGPQDEDAFPDSDESDSQAVSDSVDDGPKQVGGNRGQV